MLTYSEIESYISLEQMKELMHCLSLADKSVHDLASSTELIEKPNDHELAIIGLASTSYSIFYAVIPLLRSGLLIPAGILLRAFMDRLGTIAWLRTADAERLDIYLKYWHDIKKRPSIKTRLKCLNNYVGSLPTIKHLEFNISDHLIDDWLNLLHSFTHGDDEQAKNNSIVQKEFIHFAAGPDSDHPEMCASLAGLCVVLFGQFYHELSNSIGKKVE